MYTFNFNREDAYPDTRPSMSSKIIDEEFSSSEEQNSPDDSDEQEIDSICQSINEGENKYTLDADKNEGLKEDDPFQILERVKRTRENERDEDR